VIGSADAPYINELADTYGLATGLEAGYPTNCPSLAAYLILTSGDYHGICDDRTPAAHQIDKDNVFNAVALSGKEWRVYAESTPYNCAPDNSSDGLYLVRHAPPPYYTSEHDRCNRWDVQMGSTTSGAFHDDLTAGRLPAYSFVAPNACNDMHGTTGCDHDRVARGDAWLAEWMPEILAGPDFTAGRLAVFVTWDEGSRVDNHVPTLVISPTTHQVKDATPWTHCSTLRTTQEILGLPMLGCAAHSTSMATAFGL